MKAKRTRVAVLVVTGSLGVVLISCGRDDKDDSAFDVPLVYDLRVDPAKDVKAIDPARADVLSAAQLRGTLEHGLTWHGITLVEVMRAARRGDPDVQGWIDQLVHNTGALTADVGLAYGPVAARAFNQLWAQHTQFLVDYAVAVGSGDEEAQDEALLALADYSRDSASFWSTATDGALDADTVQALLDTHVAHMVQMIDADAADDPGGSVDAAVTDNAYLSTIAQGLAAGIAQQLPTAFPGAVDSPSAEYCSIVTRESGRYILGTLMTGDSANPVVQDASKQIETTTDASVQDVVGVDGGFTGADNAAVAQSAKEALDHAVDFAAGSTNPTIAPPVG